MRWISAWVDLAEFPAGTNSDFLVRTYAFFARFMRPGERIATIDFSTTSFKPQ